MFNHLSTYSLVAATLTLVACSSGGNNSDDTIPLRSPDGSLSASLRYTTGGVPHIRGNDLASVAFGAGYAQAKDSVCLIAESIVKVRGERALFFGPGENKANIISDFSYRAITMGSTNAQTTELSPQSAALIDGFAAGYNQYIDETPASGLPPACREQAWVRPLSREDLLAYYTSVAKYASGDNFTTGAIFGAVPAGTSVEPSIVILDSTSSDHAPSREIPGGGFDHALEAIAEAPLNFNSGLASNAWAIGSSLTESGRGALLANPHFPYTGPRRLYQMHLTIDDAYDVNGAGLIGVPLPLIGFNESIAWTHTTSTSSRFTVYELTLAEGDNMTYVKDGEPRAIQSETIEIEVNDGTGTPLRLARDVYFSEYGPMLAMDLITGGALPSWGQNETAYTYRDANDDVGEMLDTWLYMGMAENIDDFQKVFMECGSTLWTNTTYTDAAGNAFYIDSTSVPQLSSEAIATINAKLAASQDYAYLFDNGIALLEGNSTRDDWIEGDCGGLVPYSEKPKLLRTDFVQNSNSSHWQSNPAEPLTGYSPLFGDEQFPVNARTQLGLRMLQSPDDSGFADSAPAGQDGKFNAAELLEVIWNNRSLYAELGLAELRERCELVGEAPVTGESGTARSLSDGCSALNGWDGMYNIDSAGAHVFRVFMAKLFGSNLQLDVVFDPSDPANTRYDFPMEGRGTPDDAALQLLASALDTLDSVGIAYDATLGSVQHWTPSGGVPPNSVLDTSTPVSLADPIPWHGGSGAIDGVFNAIGVVRSSVEENTILPRQSSPTLPSSDGLSAVAGEGWAIARGTSWHFGLEFTDNGPEAYGLLSYSQSTDPASEHFIDQSLAYSSKTPRLLLYREEDIAANLLPNGEIDLSGSLNTQ